MCRATRVVDPEGAGNRLRWRRLAASVTNKGVFAAAFLADERAVKGTPVAAGAGVWCAMPAGGRARAVQPAQQRPLRGRRRAMRRLRNRVGLSLVEVTIMLLVLMLLAGVLAPSIMDFVRDAQWVKVKEDCEAIGISVARMMRDVPPCFRLVGTDACTVDNRVDLLWSDGNTTGGISPTSSASTNYTLAGGNASGSAELGHEHHRPGRQHGAASGAERPARAIPPAARALSRSRCRWARSRAPGGAARTCRRRSGPTPGAARTW